MQKGLKRRHQVREKKQSPAAVSGVSGGVTEGTVESVRCGMYKLRCTAERRQRARRYTPTVITPESTRQVNRQQPSESSGENDIPSPIKRTQKMNYEEATGKQLWNTLDKEAFFIRLLKDKVIADASAGRSTVWTPKLWREIANKMSQSIGLQYTDKQCHQKYNQLKIDYNVFQAVKNQTGNGWDEETFTVTAPDSFWLRAPAAQQKFRNQGFPHYYAMMTIVGGNQAIGVMRRTSRQGPPTSEEEDDLEELLTGNTVGTNHCYASNMDDVNRIVNERAAYKRKHGSAPQGSDSASKRTKSSNAADTFLQAATEASLRHMELSEAKLKTIHINDPTAAANNDNYKERDVQKAILEYKNQITCEQYVKAFQQLGDARWSAFFMETPDEMKLGVLQSIDLFSPKVVAQHSLFQPYYAPQFAAPSPHQHHDFQPPFPAHYPCPFSPDIPIPRPGEGGDNQRPSFPGPPAYSFGMPPTWNPYYPPHPPPT